MLCRKLLPEVWIASAKLRRGSGKLVERVDAGLCPLVTVGASRCSPEHLAAHSVAGDGTVACGAERRQREKAAKAAIGGGMRRGHGRQHAPAGCNGRRGPK